MNRRQFLQTTTATAVASTLPACKPTPSKLATPTLKIVSWTDYISQAAIDSFQNLHHCTVEVLTYESNSELRQLLQSGAKSCDLIVPSSYLVAQLIREGEIQPLKLNQIPNHLHIQEAFLKKTSDPAMAYSVPYMVAPTCLAYLKSQITSPTPSWSLIMDPSLKGKISLLDDMREVLGAALKSLGFSLNSTNPSELAAARDLVLKWKSQISHFDSHKFAEGFERHNLALIQGYAGDLLRVAQQNEDIQLFIPHEGCAWSCDCLCIPHDAKEVELAHHWINHVSNPEVCAENMESIGFRAPNAKATSFLSDDYRGNSVLFPEDSILDRCELISDRGPNLSLWTQEWQKIKNS